MNESQVTFVGWVGQDVEVRTVGQGQVAVLRVGSTPSWQKDGVWVDGETTWYTVNAWRTLGRNVAQSVKRGDAVVVNGRQRTETWERDGQRGSKVVVDATFIGHDLNRGTSTFVRTPREQAQPGSTPGSTAGSTPGESPGETSGATSGAAA